MPNVFHFLLSRVPPTRKFLHQKVSSIFQMICASAFAGRAPPPPPEAPVCTMESGTLTTRTQNFVALAGSGITFAGGSLSTYIVGNVGSYPLLTVVAGDARVNLTGIDYLAGSETQLASADIPNMLVAANSKVVSLFRFDPSPSAPL